jgi:hypothetical protein
MASIGKTTPQLYRDCLRLANHVASDSPKGRFIRSSIRSSFKKHMHITDPTLMESLRGNAIRALANYLMAETGLKDEKMKRSIDSYSARELDSVKSNSI